MTTPEGLIDRSLAEFLRAVAAPGPVPGSGSVAAALGALGAALASMALAPARGEGPVPAAVVELRAAMEALLADVDEDARAYQGYLEARAGRGGLQPAVERSIAVPREVAERALGALERLAAAWEVLRPGLVSEGVTAAQALLACVEGAAFTAGANLSGLADARSRTLQARELERLRTRARELVRSLAARAPGASA